MDLTNTVKDFVSSINEKFANDECNLSYNKLEFIYLVQQAEEKFNVEITDEELNEIVKVSDLIEKVSQKLA